MSKTRIGIVAVAGAGIVGALVGAPLISSATTADTTRGTGVATANTGGATIDTSPNTTNEGDRDAGEEERCPDQGPPRGRGPWNHVPMHHRRDRPGAIIDGLGLAELLGVTPDELRTAHAEGDSIADIAAEQGVDLDVVIDSLVEDAQARLDEHRQRINDRIDERASSLEERITELVTGD